MLLVKDCFLHFKRNPGHWHCNLFCTVIMRKGTAWKYTPYAWAHRKRVSEALGRDTEFSWDVQCLHTHVVCSAALPCSALPGEPRQTQKQLHGGSWTDSVAASEIIKENFIADEPSDRTCLVTTQLWGRRKGFNRSSKRQICRSLWLHFRLKEMLVVSTESPLLSIQFWLYLAFACKWRANLRALRAVETAGLLFSERLLTFWAFQMGFWLNF